MSIELDGNEVTISHPRSADAGNEHLHVSLCDVRASTSIRIHYDFELDAWVIQKPKYIFTCNLSDETWVTVAVVESNLPPYDDYYCGEEVRDE